MNGKTGAEAVEKAAQSVEKDDLGVDALAEIAFKLRSERLQKMFDWFSEDTQRDLLRADDRFFVMKFLEKWAPQMDPKSINIPMSAMRNIFSVFATFGVIDAKPEILQDMRGTPGSGILSLPDSVIALALKAIGAPEAYPLFKAAKAVNSAKESIAPKVREKVMEKVVANNTEHYEDEETHAAGIKKS
ncbi:hypothetical protein HY463_01580 [Candidatus Peregrinibacteria bacterium]|nr:hypothetical protein [Candidatus Peregrinibacteria bacterium]